MATSFDAGLAALDAQDEGNEVFSKPIPVSLDRLGLNQSAGDRGNRRIAGLVAANGSVLVALSAFEVVRWYPIEDEASAIDFGRDRCGDIGRVLLEPKGFHALVTNSDGDSWHLNFQSNQAKLLPKLKGHVIEAVSWDPESTPTSTRDLLVGTCGGQILHVIIEASKEKTVKPVFSFDIGTGTEVRRIPVCGIQRDFSSEKLVVFAAAGCGIYAFVGTSIETVFQRSTGEGASARALVYEVPRDSPRGSLQIDDACFGSTPGRVLFWMTGVGVLAATIRTPLDVEAGVLESPPGIIPFPQKKANAQQSRSTGGSLVASLLPPAPGPVPISMALTRLHILFVFEDRWAAVSRITHEVVQQQEWATATYGSLRGLSRDLHGDRLWICSERHVFEITADREDANAWALLLRLEQFEEALAACKKPSQRSRVLAAHADWLFREGHYLKSARKFAEATAVPFEHAALRFIGIDHKAALLEYLRCRFRRCPVEDKVTRALLAVWAVEVSLAHLNELQLRASDAKGRAGLDAERTRLIETLRDARDLDVHATIYHLLQSHGWIEELLIFAEARRDFTTVILHHVSRGECLNAIRKLSDFCGSSVGQDLVCRFAPVLFGAAPREFSSLLLHPQMAGLDPLSVLPAIFTPDASPLHRAESIRYLEHALQHNPTLQGKDSNLSSRIRHGSLLLHFEDSQSKLSGWASGTAVLNALIVLYAGDCHGDRQAVAEDQLLRFLDEQKENPMLDMTFALRVCGERGFGSRAAIQLYSLMGMHDEAVAAALTQGDITLAKHSASQPADVRLRQKLWKRIVEHFASRGEVEQISRLVRESQELTVRDVLPFMSDSMTIGAFQQEICDCLDAYEGQIITLRQEMDDHRRALSSFKEDLKQAEERCVVISPDQSCMICGENALRERFYAFACAHCFHEACLRALVVTTLPSEKAARLYDLEDMRLQHQAREAGSMSGRVPPLPLALVEDELDGLLADDCPLCGRLMIQSIRRGFLDAGEDDEIESWAIK